MIPNDPTTNISGAVLSDRDIRRIVAQGKISIKTPKEDRKDEFENAIEDERENPPSCLESAGYLMKPDAYWDGNDFVLIGRAGYELRPNQHAVVRTLQHIKLSEDYCALHFGLHRNQMVGVFIGNGQIQPEWGPAPLYVTIWNSGKANFIIRREEAISRLMFLRMTSGNVTGRFTRERVVRDSIKRDLAEQTARERREKLRVLALDTVGIALIVAAFFFGSLALPFLAGPPPINSNYIGLFFGAITYLIVGARDTWKGLRK